MAGEKLGIGTQTLSSPINGGVAAATARPYTPSTYNTDEGLTLEVIEKNLQIESTLDDVFMGISDPVVYTGEKVSVPNDFVMKLSFEQGANTAIIPIRDALTGAPRQGISEKQRGYERDFTMKYMKVYYNEYSQAITGEKWGKNYNDLQKFNYYASGQPGLSKYFQELHGKHYREALLETYSEPLTKAGASLTQHWNPNFFIPNTEFGSQPAYDSTLADFTANIATAMAAADTGTNGVNANISLEYLRTLEHYARVNKRINTINLGNGVRRYVCVLPSTQVNRLMANQAGQLGNTWVDYSGLSKEEMMYPGTIGKIGNMLIVSDDRYPTMEFSDYGATPTVTVEYVDPGNDDSRNTDVYDSSTNLAWDIGYLLGQNAVWDWTCKDIHFEHDNDEYDKIYGKGGFTERGIGLTFFDVDSGDQTDSTRDNWASIVLPFTALSLVATA